jgi:galactosamine-6-phosphate isomerase
MKRTPADRGTILSLPGLTIHVAEDYEAMSRAAARHVAAALRANPTALLCLATGATPARTYELLVEAGRRKPALFRHARLLKLDEWGGLAADDPAACGVYLQEKLCRPLGIGRDRFFGWRSQPRRPQAECARIATWLAVHGPIDVNILGLGVNGHLGFNEPAAALPAGPHVARLSPASRRHSMLGTSRARPRYGLTLGMGDLLHSREVVLLVNGSHKAAQLHRLLTGHVTPRFPASFLRLHPALTVFCDRASAALLPRHLRR